MLNVHAGSIPKHQGLGQHDLPRILKQAEHRVRGTHVAEGEHNARCCAGSTGHHWEIDRLRALQPRRLPNRVEAFPPHRTVCYAGRFDLGFRDHSPPRDSGAW